MANRRVRRRQAVQGPPDDPWRFSLQLLPPPVDEYELARNPHWEAEALQRYIACAGLYSIVLFAAPRFLRTDVQMVILRVALEASNHELSWAVRMLRPEGRCALLGFLLGCPGPDFQISRFALRRIFRRVGFALSAGEDNFISTAFALRRPQDTIPTRLTLLQGDVDWAFEILIHGLEMVGFP